MSFSGLFQSYDEIVNSVIQPPKHIYSLHELGPKEMSIKNTKFRRTDLRLKNRRGYTIECSHFETFDTRSQAPCVIYLHANGCSRIESMEYLEIIGLNGMSLFCFDFSGSGMSEGSYCTLGWFEQDDLECVIEYLTNSGKTSRIGVWGRSMGAITALLYAKRDTRITCMVLDSPFTSFKQFAKDFASRRASIPGFVTSAALSIIRGSIQSRANFDIDHLDPMIHASSIKIPAIFAAAEGDTFVLPSHSLQLYENYRGSKKKHIIFVGDHNSPRPPIFRSQVLDFFKHHLFEPLIEKRISFITQNTQEDLPTRRSEFPELSKNFITERQTSSEKKKLTFRESTLNSQMNNEQFNGVEEGEERIPDELSKRTQDGEIPQSTGTKKTEKINFTSSKKFVNEKRVNLSFTWTTNNSLISQNFSQSAFDDVDDKGRRSSAIKDEEFDIEAVGSENCPNNPKFSRYQVIRENRPSLTNTALSTAENIRKNPENTAYGFKTKKEEKISASSITKKLAQDRNISFQSISSFTEVEGTKESIIKETLPAPKSSELASLTQLARAQGSATIINNQSKIPAKPTSKIIGLARSNLKAQKNVNSLPQEVKKNIELDPKSSLLNSLIIRSSTSSNDNNSIVYSEENQISTKYLPNDFKANSTSRGEIDSISVLPIKASEGGSVARIKQEQNYKHSFLQTDTNTQIFQRNLSETGCFLSLEPQKVSSPLILQKLHDSQEKKHPKFFNPQTDSAFKHKYASKNYSPDAINAHPVRQPLNDSAYKTRYTNPVYNQQNASLYTTSDSAVTDFLSYYSTYNHQKSIQANRSKENLAAMPVKYRLAEYAPMENTADFSHNYH